jgi:hypothetical protein
VLGLLTLRQAEIATRTRLTVPQPQRPKSLYLNLVVALRAVLAQALHLLLVRSPVVLRRTCL